MTDAKPPKIVGAEYICNLWMHCIVGRRSQSDWIQSIETIFKPTYSFNENGERGD